MPSLALLPALVLSGLTGCVPYTPNVHISFVSESPLEVDTLPNDTDGDGFVEGYHAEEVVLMMEYVADSYVDYEIQPTVTVSGYSITYAVLNGDGEMPAYENGVTIHLDPDDIGEFPVRGVSFAQKSWAGSQFGGDLVNVRTSLTLDATTSDGDPIDLGGDFDIIAGDFVEVEE